MLRVVASLVAAVLVMGCRQHVEPTQPDPITVVIRPVVQLVPPTGR